MLNCLHTGIKLIATQNITSGEQTLSTASKHSPRFGSILRNWSPECVGVTWCMENGAGKRLYVLGVVYMYSSLGRMEDNIYLSSYTAPGPCTTYNLVLPKIGGEE